MSRCMTPSRLHALSCSDSATHPLQASAILGKLPAAQLVVTSTLPRAQFEGSYAAAGAVARWQQVDALNRLLPAALRGFNRTTLVNCDPYYLVRSLEGQEQGKNCPLCARANRAIVVSSARLTDFLWGPC